MRKEINYTANLKQNGAGKAFFTEFRHPIVLDSIGNQGKKIKKGLGNDQELAKKIVEELNWLLSNYQIATTEISRSKGFEEKTIDCFFGPILKKQIKSKSDLLDSKIISHIGSKEHVTIAAIGPTGSGKTSLIRNLIGTNPSNISFPAVSSNRTTTARIEYIFDSCEQARAAVVFASEPQIEQYIKENIIAAIREQILGDDDDDDDETIADTLLTHADMKFKLGYILGHFRKPSGEEEKQNSDYIALKQFVEKTKNLKNEAELFFQNQHIDFKDDDEKLDFYIDYYFEDESSSIDDLVDEIIALIKNKVSAMKFGEFEKLNGWPQVWFAEGEKDTILKYMEYFAGNDGKKFGELFAPLVTDIRIKANFKPYRIKNNDNLNNVTLIDTIGIGHSTKAIDSLDSEIIDTASKADLIIFVDNGSNPINQTANIAIRDLITHGNSQKMIMAYTQLDRIEDLAAIDIKDTKKNIFKVLSSAMKGYIDSGVNRSSVEDAKKHFKKNSLFLSRTNELKEIRGNTELLDEIERLITIIHEKGEEIEETIEGLPSYDYGKLYKIVGETLSLFLNNFRSKLDDNHWTKIKAMTHRISQLQWDGYENLKPISNIMSYFSIKLDDFIKSPLLWQDNFSNECNPKDSKKIKILNGIVQRTTIDLKNELTLLIVSQCLALWDSAYKHRGTGSASMRKKDVEFILKKALTMVDDREDSTFLAKPIESIIKSVIEDLKIVSS